MKKLKKILVDLVKERASPEDIALGVAVGVFIGFSPLYGVQIFVALACACLIPRVNRVAVVAGAQINWVAPLYYYFEYRLGLLILRRPGIRITLETFERLNVKTIRSHLNLETLADILWPLFIGSLVFGAVGSVIAYIIARRIVVRARAEASPQ